MRCFWSTCIASVMAMPTWAVTRSRVIDSATVLVRSFSKRRSRLVTMPTRRPPSTTGTPEMALRCMMATTSARVWRGPTVMGSTTMPDSDFFTLRTSAACSAMLRFLWMIPTPP